MLVKVKIDVIKMHLVNVYKTWILTLIVIEVSFFSPDILYIEKSMYRIIGVNCPSGFVYMFLLFRKINMM